MGKKNKYIEMEIPCPVMYVRLQYHNAKSFVSELSGKRTVEFLKLDRSQVRHVTGLLTANGHLTL
jgi:hypothetical protein